MILNPSRNHIKRAVPKYFSSWLQRYDASTEKTLRLAAVPLASEVDDILSRGPICLCAGCVQDWKRWALQEPTTWTAATMTAPVNVHTFQSGSECSMQAVTAAAGIIFESESNGDYLPDCEQSRTLGASWKWCHVTSFVTWHHSVPAHTRYSTAFINFHWFASFFMIRSLNWAHTIALPVQQGKRKSYMTTWSCLAP